MGLKQNPSEVRLEQINVINLPLTAINYGRSTGLIRIKYLNQLTTLMYVISVWCGSPGNGIERHLDIDFIHVLMICHPHKTSRAQLLSDL